MPNTPERVQSLFLKLVELAPGERAAALTRECGADVELRARVEALLKAHGEADSFLDKPDEGLTSAKEPATGEHPSSLEFLSPTADYHRDGAPGIVIAGRYTLAEKIGEGGMGEVWVAKQTEPVKRKVALKLIKTGMDSKAVVQRFEQERQALAMMDHPNIARVLDGGLTPTGQPFFVMELVNGLPLNKFCDEARLTTKARLELFVPICQAVQHAHQKGIVHRDLKPANILVTLVDGRPVPKVIDFGVAKATAGKLTEETMSTGFGAVVGTLEYMAPEQAGFSHGDIDTRADIYSLGVILYELLTGLRPIDAKRLRSAAMTEMIRIIQEEEPSKPSTRLSTNESAPSLAALRQTEPRKLMALLRGELDWVVMKALEKDRTRRYETANGLARDVLRYLADEVVEARPPSAEYRIRKYIRRHKVVVTAAALILLTLVGGIVGTTIGLLQAVSAKEQEAQQRTLAEASEKKAQQEQRLAEASEAKAQTERKRAIGYRDKAIDALRSATGEDVGKLIGERKELSANEKAYLEAIAKRWQEFAILEGKDEQTQAMQAEGQFQLGLLWEKLNRSQEALDEYQKAAPTLEKLSSQFPDDENYRKSLAVLYSNFGNILRTFHRFDESQEKFRSAIAIQEKIADQRRELPEERAKLAMMRMNLGLLFSERDDLNGALEQLTLAKKDQQLLIDQWPESPQHQLDLAFTLRGLGRLLGAMGEQKKAVVELENSRELLGKLVAENSTNPEYRFRLGVTQNTLGTTLIMLGEADLAKKAFEGCCTSLEPIADQYPLMPDYRLNLGAAYANLANIAGRSGDPGAAKKLLAKGIEIFLALDKQFPNSHEYKQSLAKTYALMAQTCGFLGEQNEAKVQMQKAVEIGNELARRYPQVPAYQIDASCFSGMFAELHYREGDLNSSVALLNDSVAKLEPFRGMEQRDVAVDPYLYQSLLLRAQTYQRLLRFAEAVKDWEQVMALGKPAELLLYRGKMALARAQAGQVAEAVAGIAEIIPSQQWESGQWYEFALVYGIASSKIPEKHQEYADRAVVYLQQAVKGGWKDAAAITGDTAFEPLREREDFKQLLLSLEKSPDAEPSKAP